MAEFPFDLMHGAWLVRGGPLGRTIARLEPLCLKPPWPWGQWLYGRLLQERFPRLQGDLVECGVAKGGTAVFLGRLANAAGRKVYALDSFAGLPEPDPERDNIYFRRGDYAPRPDRGNLLERFHGVLADEGLHGVVEVLPGFFDDTLATLPEAPLAFVHVDADLYDSVSVSLEALWPRIVRGGILAIDDFFHHAQGPARAAGDFFRRLGVRPWYHVSFPYSVLVVKGEEPPPGLRRALDGNFYSLDLLRRDPLLRVALEDSAERLAQRGPSRSATNAALLRELLRSEHADRSGDIYDYWRALEDYWDDMDVERSGPGEELRI